MSSDETTNPRGAQAIKANEIKIGGVCLAKVSGRVVPCKVNDITVSEGRPFRRKQTIYWVTNLKTDRRTTFRSAAKFREDVTDQYLHC